MTGRDAHRDAEEAHRDGHRDGRDAEPEPLEAEAPAAGSLAAAVERWLDGGDERIGEAVAATLRTLAVELDRDPKRSPLWARFLTAVELALEAEAAHKREAAEYHAALMTASAHAQSEWRRIRQLIGAEEWERGARLVPLPCAWGDHRWHRWPAGAIECSDCGCPGQQVADGIVPAPGDWRAHVGLAGGGERPS